MASRTYTDARGTEWTVWSVNPADHAGSASAHVHLPPEMARGWLCFESAAEKRRLFPVPEGWERVDAGRLGDLLAASRPVPARLGRRADRADLDHGSR